MEQVDEQQKAQEVEEKLTSLLVKARRLVVEKIQELHGAIEQAQALVAETRPLARKFNLEIGKTLVFGEDFALLLNNAPLGWLKELVTPGSIQIHGQTAPLPGKRMQIGYDAAFRDYPRGCKVAVSLKKARELEERRCGYPIE